MPLMAHKEHGFKSCDSGEAIELKKAGWEICNDPMEYKRRVWGIGVKKEEPKPAKVEPIAVVEEAVTMKPDATERKRPGRPRIEDQPTQGDGVI